VTAAFRGWPPEAVEFLTDLEANNDRDWFKANRWRHEEFVLAPARLLAEDLEEFGGHHIFRPWNDTRFHARPPIKEHLGMTIGYGGAGGFYIELSLDGLVVAAGLYRPAPDQVDRMRRAIDTPTVAGALERAVEQARAAGLAFVKPELTRAPRGYPADHPRLDLLRRKRLTVSRRDELRKWMHRPEAGRRIRDALAGGAPLVQWLHEHVGPSQNPRGRR
jgi:uncharacterized protein (TIGR02453 family)